MARALHIERPGARYHATARGNERKPIYRDDRDGCHFLELLGEATGRFGVRMHGYVLNHGLRGGQSGDLPFWPAIEPRT